jgi:hypothetical protein
MELSKKSVLHVLFEALIVGILLIVIYMFLEYIKIDEYIGNISNKIDKQIVILFVSGFLFHIIFEYTGLNILYVKEYIKLL